MKISKHSIITALSMLLAHYVQMIEYFEENEIPFDITNNAVLRLRSHKYKDFQINISVDPLTLKSKNIIVIKIFDSSILTTTTYFDSESNSLFDEYFRVAKNARNLIIATCNFIIKSYFDNRRKIAILNDDKDIVEIFSSVDDLNSDDYYLAYCFTVFENPPCRHFDTCKNF